MVIPENPVPYAGPVGADGEPLTCDYDDNLLNGDLVCLYCGYDHSALYVREADGRYSAADAVEESSWRLK